MLMACVEYEVCKWSVYEVCVVCVECLWRMCMESIGIAMCVMRDAYVDYVSKV